MGHCFSTDRQDSRQEQEQKQEKQEKQEQKQEKQEQKQEKQEQKQEQEQPFSFNTYANSTYENTPEYTLEGLRSTVKILRILDGDTVDIALYHSGDKVYRHRVRLNGIDTPEKRPALSDPNRQLEIEASKRSKDALEQRIKENDDVVLAVFYRPDKYGRLLCTFYDKNGDNINQWMITHGFAYEYHGKTKKAFEPLTISL